MAVRVEMDAREGYSDPAVAKVRPQARPARRADLPRSAHPAGQLHAADVLGRQHLGHAAADQQDLVRAGAAQRQIDIVLMSIGGNDVGFGGLVSYSMTESASDFAPIAAAIGRSLRFGPDVSRVYLESLDERMQALKQALNDGFGVTPNRVFQSSYEPLQYDETGGICGAQPTLGMDVHVGLKLSKVRLQETADFLRDFLGRLDCIASTSKGKSCPAGLATGSGTGFNLITDHLPEFSKRGICARDPRRAFADGVDMRVPRKTLRATSGSPIRRPRRCPCAALAAVPHAERRVPRGEHSPRGARCSTSCSRSGPGCTAAPSIRPRKRTRSSPTTWSSMCARRWRRASRCKPRRSKCAPQRHLVLPAATSWPGLLMATGHPHLRAALKS
jgi:hypothetical protein